MKQALPLYRAWASISLLAMVCLGSVTVRLARADSKVLGDSGEVISEATDLTYPGVLPMRVSRFYGSRSNFKGVLGEGWSFDFETRLRVSADGGVVVQEGGGGFRNRFVPISGRGADIEKVVDDLVQAKQRSGEANGTGSVNEFRSRLRLDPEFRDSEAARFAKKGLFKTVAILKGAQLISERFGYEYVSKIEDGWLRRRSDALWEHFDDSGRLTRVSDDRGNFMDYQYDNHGHLMAVRDRLERRILLSYDGSGRISRINGLYNQTVEYHYDRFGQLTSVKSVDGPVTDYKYDDNHRGLLIEARYPFGRHEQFTYSDSGSGENVKTFRDVEGWTVSFEYAGDFYTRTTRDANGEIREAAKIQNTWSARSSGDKWLSKSTVTIGDDTTETTFNECCAQPLRIQSGLSSQTFEYDSRARLVKKTAPDQTDEWAFDSKSGQLLKHVVTPKTGGIAHQTDYFYDAGGELLSISETSGGAAPEKFGFSVDPLGRILSVTDPHNRKYHIQYAAGSVPTDITDNTGRHMHVIYAEALKPFTIQVENSETMGMLGELTEDFERLKDILPAGKFNFPEVLEQMRDLKSALVMTKRASR